MHPDPLEGLHITPRPADKVREIVRSASREDRLCALQLAIQFVGRDSIQHESVIEAAESFLKFITESTATN